MDLKQYGFGLIYPNSGTISMLAFSETSVFFIFEELERMLETIAFIFLIL